MQENSNRGLRLVVHPDANRQWVVTAAAQIPPAAFSDDVRPDLFPKEKHVGPCRICSNVTDLTEEHLPPRGAFNKKRSQEIDVDEVLGSDTLDPRGGPTVQGGIRGYMLCEDCNNFTGRNYGREYQEWARRAGRTIVASGMSPDEIDELEGFPQISVGFRDVYPGRFIRQVISMMLSISGSHELAQRFPDLPELALGGVPRALPDPLRLYLNLYAHNVTRLAGGPAGQGWYSAEEQAWRWLLEISFAPLSTILLIDGPPDPALGVDITELTEWDPDLLAKEIRFDDLLIGFGHKPFPADFRTKGQLLMQRDIADTEIEPPSGL